MLQIFARPPAGVGKSPPRRSATNAYQRNSSNELPGFITQPCPRRRGKTPEKAKAGPSFWPQFFESPLSEKTTISVLNGVLTTNRRSSITRKIFEAKSRPVICSKTHNCSLSQKYLVLRTTGQTLPKRGLPLLLGHCFLKPVGARFYWETFKRSNPRNEPDMTGELETSQNRKPRTHTSTFLRACRALTGCGLCCRAINVNVKLKA